MTWSVDLGVQLQNLLTQIGTRLVAGGWTELDGTPNFVYTATNNQGALNCLQISTGTGGGAGTYRWLQLQGWQSWDAVGHAGTNGTGTTYHRIYCSPNNETGTVTVDLYMSVTANRVIIYINGVSNYRHWGYFGGLDSLAGTSDPTCVGLTTSYEQASTADVMAMLQSAYTPASFWTGARMAILCTITAAGASVVLPAQGMAGDAQRIYLGEILVVDNAATNYIRGNLDGVKLAPGGSGTLLHLDTVTISGVTYLIVVFGPVIAANTCWPAPQSYANGLAIAEV